VIISAISVATNIALNLWLIGPFGYRGLALGTSLTAIGNFGLLFRQLQRSAGVFFDDDKGKTVASGKLLYSARVIPYRGSWVEFEFDANDILFVRVDRRRKMLATAFLRAFTFLEKGVVLSDAEILGQFYELEEVLSFEDRTAWVKLHPEVHNGIKVSDDVKPPKHREALVASGKALNPKLIEKLLEAGVTRIPVKADSLVGRRTGDRVVDADTGEVLVGVLCGSASDLPVMQQAGAILERFGIPHELRVMSAHRSPDLVDEYARTEPRVKVAHLPTNQGIAGASARRSPAPAPHPAE
jgi:DNA-directed RNA polymerase beta subunit